MRAFIVFGLLTLWSIQAQAGRHVALVLGNGEYRYAEALKNPRNDASDVAAALVILGFEVSVGYDLTRSQMQTKITEFLGTLKHTDQAVFYYAGHGLQVAGKNYLVPVDAELTVIADVSRTNIPLESVYVGMSKRAKASAIIVDACRSNPLAEKVSAGSGPQRSLIGRGFAAVKTDAECPFIICHDKNAPLPIGAILAYSTQPDSVAEDGYGRNSPFTAALVRKMVSVGNMASDRNHIGRMLDEVRSEVVASTQQRQIPWDAHMLTEPFFLRAADAAKYKAERALLYAKNRKSEDAWKAICCGDSVKVSNYKKLLQDFVAEHGDTIFAEFARERLDKLQAIK